MVQTKLVMGLPALLKPATATQLGFNASMAGGANTAKVRNLPRRTDCVGMAVLFFLTAFFLRGAFFAVLRTVFFTALRAFFAGDFFFAVLVTFFFAAFEAGLPAFWVFFPDRKSVV